MIKILYIGFTVAFNKPKIKDNKTIVLTSLIYIPDNKLETKNKEILFVMINASNFFIINPPYSGILAFLVSFTKLANKNNPKTNILK